MKTLYSILFILMTITTSFAQDHFTMYGELRLDGNLVYCDLKAAHDYEISSMQFGFHHDSDHSQFLDIETNIPDLDNNKFNEVCPKYVRLVWAHPMGTTASILKDEVVMTLVYQINREEEHFICMMESGPDNCENFLREVTDKDGQILPVDDVCVKYNVKGGQVIITQIKEYLNEKSSTYYRIEPDELIVELPDLPANYKLRLSVSDVSGKVLYRKNMVSGVNRCQMNNYASGSYIYSFILDDKIVRSGKFIKP